MGRLAVAASLLASFTPALAWSQPIPIQHVIIIMQENRSFDSYFGTYPRADGIPAGTCVPLDPANLQLGCVTPFHDQHDINAGALHTAPAAQADLADGITTAAMNGFVATQTSSGSSTCARVPPKIASRNGSVAAPPPAPVPCKGFAPGIARHDTMGYHTADEIPNYWAYADHFVLQDKLFEGVRSWSAPEHLDLVSEWSAICKDPRAVGTCTTTFNPLFATGNKTLFPWVNLFQLLDQHGVSWKYYLGDGAEPDCRDGQMTCEPQTQAHTIPSLWNPAPGFASVQAQGAAYVAAHNPAIDQFLIDINNGTLPQVSWVVPADTYSEHPANSLTAGMEYVTALVNAVMQSPTYWANTAIFISWDDWGGFYDHVVPPNVDRNSGTNPIQGFGLRVPGLLISAYARPGFIDHNVLSHDSYARFIEHVFLNDIHLDPAALGQPDARPSIRDALTSVTYYDGSTAPIGDLTAEFDFTQTPLPPLVLSTHIPILPVASCHSSDVNYPERCTSGTVKIGWASVQGPQVPGPFTYHVLRDGGEVPGCVTTRTSCQDTPGSGVHFYRIYSVDSSNVASPSSAAAEADVP